MDVTALGTATGAIVAAMIEAGLIGSYADVLKAIKDVKIALISGGVG